MPYMYSEMQNALSKTRKSPLESMGQIISSRCPSADERIREDIQVPDSLGKETFQVGIFTSSGNLKDQ